MRKQIPKMRIPYTSQSRQPSQPISRSMLGGFDGMWNASLGASFRLWDKTVGLRSGCFIENAAFQVRWCFRRIIQNSMFGDEDHQCHTEWGPKAIAQKRGTKRVSYQASNTCNCVEVRQQSSSRARSRSVLARRENITSSLQAQHHTDSRIAYPAPTWNPHL